MKMNLKVVWNIVQVFILAYVFIVTLFVININEYGYSQFGKSTYVPITKKEMKHIKDVKKGQLFIIKKDKIKENDKLYYYTVSDTEYLISESVVTEIDKGSYIIEGDFIISEDRIIGNKTTSIGIFGFILSFLLKEIGYLCFCILPVFIILVYYIVDFCINTRKLNNIRIETMKRTLTLENTMRMNRDDFNKSMKKIVEDIEILDEVDNKKKKDKKKDDIEILDF